MEESITRQLNKRARFISGSKPQIRELEQPIVQSAIEDAINVINSLDRSTPVPCIFSGTTSLPSHIVTLSWLIGESSPTSSVSISCKGFQQFDLFWEEANGTTVSIKVDGLEDLKSFDISSKIKDLIISKNITKLDLDQFGHR